MIGSITTSCLLHPVAQTYLAVNALTVPVWATLELARPIMLWWAVAAVIPWLLWLRRPENAASVRWGAMQFLRQDAPRIAARDHRRQWYLLALRMAALLLIPLAMAQPTWYSDGSRQVPAATTAAHWIFVLDASASMQSQTPAGTRWQEAQELLSARLDDLPSTAAVSLIIASNVCRVVPDHPSGNRDTIRQAMESSDVSYTALDWNKLYPQLEQLIRAQSKDFSQQHVVFISDLQATTWRRWDEPPSLQTLQRQFGTRLTWELDLANGTSGPNLTLSGLRVDQPVTTAGRKVRGTATVRNWDRQSRPVTATFSLDGTSVGSHDVTVPPEAEESVEFEFAVAAPGLLELSAEISSDALPADNVRSVPVQVYAEFPVVLVRESMADDSVLPAILHGVHGAPYQFDCDSRRPSQLLVGDWQSAPVIVIDQVSRWSAAERDAVSAYLTQGGAAVFFLGPESSADTVNAWRAQGDLLSPCQLLSVAPRGSYRFAWSEPRRTWSLDRIFAAYPQSGFLRIPIWQYWQLDCPVETRDDSIWLRFADGSPAAVAHSVGAGMSVIFMTNPSLANDANALPWSALGTWPGLVPLVHETVFQAAGFRQQPRTAAAGIVSPGPHTNHTVAGTDPTSAEPVPSAWQPLRLTRGPSKSQAATTTPDRPGCYVPISPIRTPQPRDVLQLVVPAEESDLRPLSIDSLSAFAISVNAPTDASTSKPLRSRTVGHSLTGLAILLAAILLAIESYGSRHTWM